MKHMIFITFCLFYFGFIIHASELPKNKTTLRISAGKTADSLCYEVLTPHLSGTVDKNYLLEWVTTLNEIFAIHNVLIEKKLINEIECDEKFTRLPFSHFNSAELLEQPSLNDMDDDFSIQPEETQNK